LGGEWPCRGPSVGIEAHVPLLPRRKSPASFSSPLCSPALTLQIENAPSWNGRGCERDADSSRALVARLSPAVAAHSNCLKLSWFFLAFPGSNPGGPTDNLSGSLRLVPQTLVVGFSLGSRIRKQHLEQRRVGETRVAPRRESPQSPATARTRPPRAPPDRSPSSRLGFSRCEDVSEIGSCLARTWSGHRSPALNCDRASQSMRIRGLQPTTAPPLPTVVDLDARRERPPAVPERNSRIGENHARPKAAGFALQVGLRAPSRPIPAIWRSLDGS